MNEPSQQMSTSAPAFPGYDQGCGSPEPTADSEGSLVSLILNLGCPLLQRLTELNKKVRH